MHDIKVSKSFEITRRAVVLVAFAAVLLPIATRAQTTYHDPKGRFDLQVPTGWSAAPDSGADQIIVHHGAAQAIIAVIQQNKSNSMTAKEFVDSTVIEFKQQCPTTQERQSGTVTLAGAPGIYTIVTCSDPKSPAVAEASAVLTPNYYMVGFTMISPLSQYYANLPVLDGIRTSLHVTGNDSTPAVSKDADPLGVTEAKKACAVGAFTQEECARQIGIQYSKQTAGEDTAAAAKANVYRDPSGRFSFSIPEGWTATSEGDKGINGVQLRSGSNWINVIPVDPAPSASEVVLRYETNMAAKSNSGRKPPFGSTGLLQLFGHGVELTWDNFSANGADGTARDSYIGGVSEVSGTGQNHLLLVASIDGQQKDDGGKAFLTVGQSIQFGAH
ncbi:MAG TPA: hypothetical protein VK574_19890 [Terracidiphilus sp.]|nr:hypothetical protein [Terracidiphilus sp.]